MDKIAQKISDLCGSAPFIFMHIIWFAVWLLVGWSKELLTLIVSLEAIFLTLFILRAETVQARHNERQNKKIIKKVK